MMITDLSLALRQVHFNCDQNEVSATKGKERSPREGIATAKTPKEGKYLGVLTQQPGLNRHTLTASGRFIAVFGSCREKISQHADGVGYVLYLKTCLLPKELLR